MLNEVVLAPLLNVRPIQPEDPIRRSPPRPGAELQNQNDLERFDVSPLVGSTFG
jgi:hypothetical protein